MRRAEVLLGRMPHSVVGPGACQWAVGGPEEEYDYVQYPEYAEKVEEYCSRGQERVEHQYWYWRQ